MDPNTAHDIENSPQNGPTRWYLPDGRTAGGRADSGRYVRFRTVLTKHPLRGCKKLATTENPNNRIEMLLFFSTPRGLIRLHVSLPQSEMRFYFRRIISGRNLDQTIVAAPSCLDRKSI